MFEVKETGERASIAASTEDLRITVVGYRVGPNGGVTTTVTCVEPVGPAMLLQNFNANGAIRAIGSTGVNVKGQAGGSVADGGPQGQAAGSVDTLSATDINANVALAATQAVGRIYEVGEIMQFVQELSFRYCEAYANGTFDAGEYKESMKGLEVTARNLMLAQMAAQAGNNPFLRPWPMNSRQPTTRPHAGKTASTH